MPKVAIVDLHSKYPAFLEALAKSATFPRVIGVESRVSLPKDGGTYEVASGLESLAVADLSVGAFTAFECLEREGDLESLLRHVVRLLQPGGLLFLTTITWSGFDLQVLGEHSKNLLPLTHLNLLSLEGIRRLLARHGFDIVELSTPGQLDTEIVVHAVAEDPAITLSPFVDELIRRRDEHVHRAFQEFLQEALLSSHVRVVAQKEGVA